MGDVVEFAGVMGVIAASVLAMVTGIALAVRFAKRTVPMRDDEEVAALRARVAQLEQAVDVVAVEVERVGEAQRYTERLLAPDQAAARAPGG